MPPIKNSFMPSKLDGQTLSILTWIISTTPQRHAKSHHNDKCIYCLPPWPRCRPSDTLGFRCSIAIPAILLSTLSLHVTVTDSRLASNAVVNSLFDGTSTHRTIYPLLDARSDPNVLESPDGVHLEYPASEKHYGRVVSSGSRIRIRPIEGSL